MTSENQKNNSQKHLAIVSGYFYPKIGGLENYAYFLAQNLQKTGAYTVSVITSNYDGKGYKREIIDGMIVHRLPIWFKISNTPINPLWYWQIRKIFAAERPDIVHTHSPVVGLVDIAVKVAKENNISIVATYHSGSMRKNRFPIDLIISLYEKIFLHTLFTRADAVVAVSQSFAKREFPQFAYKTFFIPTGVDLERFKKTPLPLSERVMFIGRIEKNSSWKGIEQLLQACVLVLHKCPQAQLELVGGGDAVLDYQRRAQELGIAERVIFAGPQTGEKLVEAYARASVIVLPSTSDSEAFSVVLVEAMASGRPIIGTNIGGTPQVIEDGKNGLLVPAKNPEKLADAIIRVLNDKTLARDLAECGAEKARAFSWDIQTKKYSDLFEYVLKKNSQKNL